MSSNLNKYLQEDNHEPTQPGYEQRASDEHECKHLYLCISCGKPPAEKVHPSQPTEAQTKRGQELARQYGLEAEPPGEKVQQLRESLQAASDEVANWSKAKRESADATCDAARLPEPPAEKVQTKVRRCPDGCTFNDVDAECLNCANTDRAYAKPEPPQATVPEGLEKIEARSEEELDVELRKYGVDPEQMIQSAVQKVCVLAVSLRERLGAAEQRANESKMQDEAKAGYIQFIREGLHRLQKQFSTRQDEPGEAIEFIAGELGNVLQTMQERDDLEAERDRLKEQLDLLCLNHPFGALYDSLCKAQAKVAELEEQLLQAQYERDDFESDCAGLSRKVAELEGRR